MTSKSVSVTPFQYLVCPTLLSVDATRHAGYQILGDFSHAYLPHVLRA